MSIPRKILPMALIAMVAITALAASGTAKDAAPIESPALSEMVQAKKLPPAAERLPSDPRIVKVLRPGRHGGTLRVIFGRSKDTRILVVYGYARLVTYDQAFNLEPDILAGVDVQEGRIFTLRLRNGHRWSDGANFTAEDFRYYWEDIANNKNLSPLGAPKQLFVNGKPPVFEVVDAQTVRFSWNEPNPHFLPALASATPLYIYRPAHYLKQFHPRYADADQLAKLVKKSGRRNWAALHNRRDNQYKNDNPKLPTLQPWVLKTKPPAQRFLFDRNPYYHRVDQNNRQLPYADRIAMAVAAAGVIPLKTGAGETDLQARGIAFNNYTFLKEAEKRENFEVRLWQTAKGAHLTLFPNMNARDDIWRGLMRKVEFRRALSLAINRHEINQVIYYGLAIEGQNTVLPASPLYKREYRDAWAAFDLKKANALLDGLGLTKRDSRGIRLLPDGRPMEIIVETAGEDTEQTDVLELIHDSWLKAGIKLFTRPSQREVFRNRIFAGETLVSIWSGHEFGIPNADTIPEEFAPTNQLQLQWPKWGQYFQTRGRAGEKPDDPGAVELLNLNREWSYAPTEADRQSIWRQMLEINADRVYTIGLIGAVPQPVVVNSDLRNVPRRGVFNWNPGAHFGVYMPDTFWFDNQQRRLAKR
jgi:peptide/nickel transport system substrate-binding protein